ncbi:MAG TPA: response regulator [Longimicrobiales bacterium]|nr:response regulator [Longimicrobiales bacterium]
MSVDDKKQRQPVVFFVDDEPELRGAFSALLRKRGFKVLEAGNAEEAGRRIEEIEEPIDVLLMDINLPDGWGAAVAQHLLLSHPEMVVVYITGFAQDDPILAGALQDATYVLRKPFTGEELGEVLRAAMGGR